MHLSRYCIKTFGCQMNYSDSERLETILESIGLKKTSPEKADLILLNTCSIKQHAEDRVHGFVHNAKKSGKLVGLTGCMVRESSTQKSVQKDILLKKYKKIDFVFRIEDLPKLPDLLHVFDNRIRRPEYDFDIPSYLHIPPKRNENFRVFVPIMTGCDKFCTYCVVPYTRGREKSRPFDDIIEECTHHVNEGVQEITLVGQNVNAYFLDDTMKKTLQKQTDFAVLLEAVAKIPGLRRLYFTSPHPRHIEDDTLDVIVRNTNIIRSLHLPVQSGSSSVLRRMGREYTALTFIKKIQRARELLPDMTFTTDIIVGFCGESNLDFEKTMNLFDNVPFLMAYISKYSARKGTFAGEKLKDDVSLVEKKRRFASLTQKLREVASSENARAVGSIESVLVDKIVDGTLSGKSHFYRTVECSTDGVRTDLLGKIVPIKITSSSTWIVRGELIV